ncbi:MAG: sulfite exporter TauE/SafE family protein [Spirochaetota bacterium]
MTQILLVILIVFFAAFTQSVAGFGAALVSMSLLTLLLPITFVTPLVAMMGTFITISIFLRLRKNFDIKKVLPLAAGALPGIPVGIYFLTHFPESIVKKILAIVLLIYSLYSLIHVSHNTILRKEWGLLFGFLSGCLGGAFNTNGPPAIVYTSMQSWSKNDITITLQSFFLLSGIMLITMHGLHGLITVEVLHYFLLMIPVLIMGVVVGSFVYERINQDIFKKIVFILLIVLAVVLLFS